MTLHTHLTPLGGMAGDMFAAAVLDARPELRAHVLAEVAAVLPADHAPPGLDSCVSGGLTALRFDVPAHAARAPMRYPDLAALVAQSTAAEPTRHIAADLLHLLAGAEAAVHGCPIQDVHFHEIADWDTLADLAAAAAILAQDGSWSLDPLPLGGGTVQTRHGTLPVPAPAAAHLMTGLPVRDDGVHGERVTPTGACIARYIATRIGLCPRPSGVLAATGCGAGTRQLPDRPNILVAQVIEPAVARRDVVSVLEWDVDDMTGEEVAAACDALRATEGVRDLTSHSVVGKKGRIATRLRLLVEPARAEAVADRGFRQTSTIGIRCHDEGRWLLPRRVTATGGVRRKSVQRPGGATTKAESDDLAGLDSLAERRSLARKVEDGE